MKFANIRYKGLMNLNYVARFFNQRALFIHNRRPCHSAREAWDPVQLQSATGSCLSHRGTTDCPFQAREGFYDNSVMIRGCRDSRPRKNICLWLCEFRQNTRVVAASERAMMHFFWDHVRPSGPRPWLSKGLRSRVLGHSGVNFCQQTS